jgi:hypothetical protein
MLANGRGSVRIMTLLFERDLARMILITLSSCSVVACAATSPKGSDWANPTPPSSEEVIAYVETHWSSYSQRTARFQQRPDEAASLIDVRAVSCSDYYGIPDCSFTVSVSFGEGPPVDQRLSSLFDRRPDGTLFETIVLIHERVR